MPSIQMYEPAPTLQVNSEKLKDFYTKNLFIKDEMVSLSHLRNEGFVSDVAGRLLEGFPELVNQVHDTIADKNTGAVAVDIPIVYDDVTKDAISGAVFYSLLSSGIMPVILDRVNKTPFTIFNASYDNSIKLNELGFREISPIDILDFHTDGSIDKTTLSVPDFISIYNIFINYKKCGNFYWVPTSQIANFNRHVEEIGFEEKYVFDLTPSVYGNNEGQPHSINSRRTKTSIFRQDKDGHVVTFMNGTFLGEDIHGQFENEDALEELQMSISKNDFRYKIEQKSRRLIFMNNKIGFHARDIFEDPFDENSTTRSYLRCVSNHGNVVGKIIN